MKNTILSCMALLVGLSCATAQSVIKLHAEPDSNSPVISHVNGNSPQLGTPSPVEDPLKASEGWYSAPFTRSISGYVHESNLGAGGQPQVGAAVFSLPVKSSLPMTTVSKSDSVKILSSGPWSEIRIDRPSTVYFLQADVLPMPLLPKSSKAPSPATQPTSQSSAPSRIAPVAAEPIHQGFEGRFTQARQSFGLFSPKLPFQIDDIKGKRLAYVDVNSVVVPSSLQSFIGKSVIVYGRLEKLPDSKQWVIRAQTIRLR